MRASSRAVVSDVFTVRTTLASRMTLTRSLTRITSSSLCEMKMTVFPSCDELAKQMQEPVGFLRRQDRGRLVQDQQFDAVVEHLQDFDALLFANRKARR